MMSIHKGIVLVIKSVLQKTQSIIQKKIRDTLAILCNETLIVIKNVSVLISMPMTENVKKDMMAIVLNELKNNEKIALPVLQD